LQLNGASQECSIFELLLTKNNFCCKDFMYLFIPLK
jgi:hypothetical protein